MLKKIIKYLKGVCPVSRCAYEDDRKALITVLNGLTISDSHHSQVEMNLIQEVTALKNPQAVEEPEKEEKHPEFG